MEKEQTFSMAHHPEAAHVLYHQHQAVILK